MLTITKIFEFDAAHYLPGYEGKCSNTHGHRWKLEVEVKGDIKEYGTCTGMIMDFSDLKKIVEDNVLHIYDHSLLNDIFLNPTAENIIAMLVGKLITLFPNNIKLKRIRLWETPTSYAEWTNESI